MEYLKLTEEQANCIIDNLGECWLHKEKDLIYLAPVINPKDKSGNSYLIEKGVNIGGKQQGTFVSNLSEIPFECLKERKLALESCFPKISDVTPAEEFSVPIYQELTGKIKPQSVKNFKIRPLVAGSSMSALNAQDRIGTIGAFIKIDPFLEENEIFFLTNYHTVVSDKLRYNDLVFQPDNESQDYSNFIGKVYCGQYHDNSGKSNFTLDVAFIKIDRNLLKRNPVFSKTQFIGQGFLDNNAELDRIEKETFLKGINKAEIGMEVRLHGVRNVVSRTEKIRAVNAIVKVENAYNEKEYLIFKRQILLKNISSPGDSGAVLVNKKNEVVGLHHAGDDDDSVSISNNISDIFDAIYPHPQGDLKFKFNSFLT